MRDSNPKTAVGRLKPGIMAIPPSAIIALGLAMENGRVKYGLMNWRESPVSSSVYYEAIGRHMFAWWDGENVSQDAGVHHLAHVMACCAILIDAEQCRSLIDDRPVGGPAGEFIEHLFTERVNAEAARALQSVQDAQDDMWPKPEAEKEWVLDSLTPMADWFSTDVDAALAAKDAEDATAQASVEK